MSRGHCTPRSLNKVAQDHDLLSHIVHAPRLMRHGQIMGMSIGHMAGDLSAMDSCLGPAVNK